MGQVVELRAPAVAGTVESFGPEHGAETRRFRLPLRDIGDLRYVFSEMESEGGLQSSEARAGEQTNTQRDCAHCGATFRAKPERGLSPPEQKDTAYDDGTRDQRLAASTRRYCTADCRHAALLAMLGERRAWRSPPPPDPATGVRAIVCADGVTRRVYDGVAPRVMPPAGALADDEQIMYVHGACHGAKATASDGSVALLDAERFACAGGTAKKTRHTRAWACMRAIDAMVRTGHTEDVVVLTRVYGQLAPGLPYQLWSWGSGGTARTFDPKEVAPLATLTDAVEVWRKRLAAERLVAHGGRSAAGLGRAALHALAARELVVDVRVAEAKRDAARGKRRETAQKALEDARAALRDEVARAEAESSAWSATESAGRQRNRLARTVDRQTHSSEALDCAVRTLSAPQRRKGEPSAEWKTRQLAARGELRAFLGAVGREAEAMLVRASLAYRAARRSA
jgi:hypothetical protein